VKQLPLVEDFIMLYSIHRKSLVLQEKTQQEIK
jgi:hypothetical protein